MDSSPNEAAAGSPGAPPADIIGMLEQGRRQFLALVSHVRPDLHRYCTRMTGSVADGEDVVQDTLARAYYELSQWTAVPALRPWLFRIAHNRAIDHRRHEAYRVSEPLDMAIEIPGEATQQPDEVLARHQAVRAAISCFLELPATQRGCVILKDVLDHSIDEIAAELGLSVPAVKAALHRGRAGLRRLDEAAAPAPGARAISPALRRYASLFNAHDWDGVRAMLADDVKLDLVSRRKAVGRREVATYFSNYDRAGDWHLKTAWLDGHEVLAVLADPQASGPRYIVELAWADGQVVAIRDFRYIPYIAQDNLIELSDPASHRRQA